MLIIIDNRADRDTPIPQQLYKVCVSEENKEISSCLFQVLPMCRSVHEQDTEPLIVPDALAGALRGFRHHRCMNVCVNVVNKMHKLCKAPWIKALYKCTIYHGQVR